MEITNISQIWFIIAQIFGFLGMICMVISLQNKQKEQLLRWQIYSCLMYIVQYLCLGAISGCLMSLVAMIRNYLYNKFKRVPKTLVLIFLGIVIVLGAIFYQGPISLLPVVATCVFTLGLASSNLTLVRFSDAIGCLLYIVYNINVAAYTGLIATIIELASALIGIYRLDLRGRIHPKTRKSPKSHSKTRKSRQIRQK